MIYGVTVPKEEKEYTPIEMPEDAGPLGTAFLLSVEWGFNVLGIYLEYRVAAKALARKGEWQPAYEKLCTGNKIDEDDDSRALQKQLQAKVAKVKKIEELRAKRAAEAAEAKDEKPVEVA